MESDRELSAVALPEGQGVVGMSKGDQKIKSPRYISPRGVMHSVVTTVKDTALQGHLGGSVVERLSSAQGVILGFRIESHRGFPGRSLLLSLS